MTIDECDPSTADRTTPPPGSGLAGALAQGRLVGGLARARPGTHRLRPFHRRIEYRLDRRCAREMVDLLGARRAARCQCAVLLHSVGIVPSSLYHRNLGDWTPGKNLYPLFFVYLSTFGSDLCRRRLGSGSTL